jgi:hypothetical protein
MTVNASRHILGSITSKAGRTFTYHGSGYTYYLHKTTKDIWAKLQIARKTMQQFLKSVGLSFESARKLSALDGVEVCEQGSGGWYEVFVIDERKLFAVINFIKKLNRFMNGASTQHQLVRKGHYFIETRKYEHTPSRNARELPGGPIVAPIVAFPQQQKTVTHKPNMPFQSLQSQRKASDLRLQQLALTVNTRYGH